MGRLILYIGGSGSGKSQVAEARALELGGEDVLYLATLREPTTDEELRERLARHRRRRPTGWHVASWSEPPADRRFSVCLVDGTGGIVADRLSNTGPDPEGIEALATELLENWRRLAEHVLVVADEVGMGVVPDNELGRRFRDEVGAFHRVLASHAEEAYLVVAGRTIALEPGYGPHLERLATALERLVPPRKATEPSAEAYRWRQGGLIPVGEVHALPLDRFVGLDRERRLLTETITAFVQGTPPVHTLLWGPPGVGKSSLVKAVWASHPRRPRLIEVDRCELDTLEDLLEELRAQSGRWLLLLDDLVLDAEAEAHRNLRGLLEGSLLAPVDDILLVATSNLRQLVQVEPSASESLDLRREQAALAQRFALRLGIPPFDEERYLAVVRRALEHYGVEEPGWESAARRFARRQGPPSGRLAWQFARLWQAASTVGSGAALAEFLCGPESEEGVRDGLQTT